MEIAEMTINELETRLAEITKELDGDCDVNALTEEVNAIEARKKEIADTAKKAEEVRAMVADGTADITTTTPVIEEERKMDLKEIRSSREYEEAFANYIKTENDAECRALMTENATNGTVPVPVIVEEIFKHAWENNKIVDKVNKTYLKGNVKVGFEISSTGAVIHTEGANAITPETLVLGIATLTPVSLKKSIQITDEVMDLSGAAFLEYIYSELAYKISILLANEIVDAIAETDGTGSSSVPAQTIITEEPGVTTIVNAIANLSDEATNPVAIMNKATYAYFRGVQANANYAIDIFEGLEVLFSSQLPAYGTADEGDIYCIVGDLGVGAQANFPNGNDITFKLDDKSLMKSDLVEILGRMYVGYGVVAPKAFTLVAKPEEEEEDAEDGGAV